MDKEEIIKKILERTNYDIKEIEKKVEEKKKLFKDFISEKGIYMLIARELGIDVTKDFVKLGSIVNGMKNISVIGRIFKISEIKEFKNGKVANVFIGDKTGYAKLTLWNDQCDILDKINVGDIIEINKVYVKENIFGDLEIALGRFSSIKILEKGDLPSLEELQKQYLSKNYKKCKINEITSVGNYEIEGTVVKVIESKKFLYNFCEICNTINCEQHLNSSIALIFSVIVDDGYGNIRSVFFREQSKKILDIENLLEENAFIEISKRILGKDLLLKGRVKKNVIRDSLEMIVHYCEFL
ncbi:MAG: OB-fold nucleic acid binding domain-containing protein [Candidatus Aenigmatarchaeota archaeon]